MASTLTDSPMTVTLSRTYTQNSKSKDFSASHVMSNIKFDDLRTMRVPSASEISILDVAAAGTAVGPGKLDSTKIQYLYIKNCDDANFVRIGLKKTGAETVYFKMSTGTILLFPTMQYDVDAAGGAFGAYVYPTTIVAQADTADVDIEYAIWQTT